MLPSIRFSLNLENGVIVVMLFKSWAAEWGKKNKDSYCPSHSHTQKILMTLEHGFEQGRSTCIALTVQRYKRTFSSF